MKTYTQKISRTKILKLRKSKGRPLGRRTQISAGSRAKALAK